MCQTAFSCKQRKAKDEELEEVNKEWLKLLEDKNKALTALSENYQQAIDPVKLEKTKAVASINLLEAEIKRLQSITDVCPTCGQKIPGKEKPSTEKQEAEVKSLRESLGPINDRITEIENKNTAYKNEINNQTSAKETELTTKLARLKRERNGLIDQINDNTQSYNLEKEKYNKLIYERDNWDKHFDKVKADLASYQQEETQLTNLNTITTNEKYNLLERQAVLRKMETLTKRDFRGYILVNVINYIDTCAKNYSDIVFGTRDLNVYLDDNALDISYCGKLIDCLSGGEKQRVDLILQLALRDLLCKYFNFSSNILVLDEITDFLDKKACDAVITLLSSALQDVESVFIISHHIDELNIPVDSELKVIKDENGISTAQ